MTQSVHLIPDQVHFGMKTSMFLNLDEGIIYLGYTVHSIHTNVT